jgi:hypothetical protein
MIQNNMTEINVVGPQPVPRLGSTDGMTDDLVVRAAVQILEQGVALLKGVSDHAYTQMHSFAFGASIGGHYRHCLDHFRSLLRGAELELVDYDQRARNRQIETDRACALAETNALLGLVNLLGAVGLDRCVEVQSQVGYGQEAPARFRSTLRREWGYVIAHAVHHYALIAIIAKIQGVSLPPDFGVAPSTVKHRETLSQPSTPA